jgi:Kef-type K+ transport system membrane component KefB
MGHHAIAILIRLVVLGVALSCYYAALPFLFPGSNDANIGAGLIAFGLVVLVSFGWALVDARRRGAAPTMSGWAVVGAACGRVWLRGLALLEAAVRMSIAERLRVDAFLAVFTAGLVFVPAGLGAAIGGSAHPSDD